MTDWDPSVFTSSTTTTTPTLLPQGHPSQPPLPHSMVVASPPQDFAVPVPFVQPQGPSSPQYVPAPLSHDPQYPSSDPRYLHPPPTGFYFPFSESQFSYGLPLPSVQGAAGLQAAQPPVSSAPLSPHAPGGEQLYPDSLIYAPPPPPPHQTVPFPPRPPSSSPLALAASSAGVQYQKPASEPFAVPEDGASTHPSHHFPQVHTTAYQIQPFVVQEPSSQKHIVFQYLELSTKERSHSQEQYAVEYVSLVPPEHQQRRALSFRRLEEEHEEIQQKRRELDERIRQIEQEKKQLSSEQQLEQQQQQYLAERSQWLQRIRMQAFVTSPSSFYGPTTLTPLPPVQHSQEPFHFPPPELHRHPSPRVPHDMESQFKALMYRPGPVSAAGGYSYSHQAQESVHAGRGMVAPTTFPLPTSASDAYQCASGAVDTWDLARNEPTATTVVHESTMSAAAPTYYLRPEVPEFQQSENPRRPPRQPYSQQHPAQHRPHHHHHRSARAPLRAETRQAADSSLQDVQKRLGNHALQSLVPSSDLDDQSKREEVKRTVTRVPAVCFNEQKFLNKEDYQVLVQPQSPAIRGQEALARVCFALEQCLRQRGTGALILSDYKFRENYLRRAPQDVLGVLNRPEDEGSHDILMIGPTIGIVCIQVTCVEAGTNSSTVKKQVRDTLKQLQKDKKVLQHVLRDLHLEDDSIHLVMALPNITSDQLKQKLETKSVKILSSVLNTTDDLEDLLTLDRLPHPGQRHWLSADSRARLWEWFDRLDGRSETLSVDNYMQIFARYTCGWSVPEVWSVSKPRVLVRTLGHAVRETYRRYHLPVLTPQQDSLLQSDHSHVLIKALAGTGHTCLLKVKAMTQLRRGCLVLVFIPQNFTSLRNEYEQIATSNEQYAENMYFWSDEDKTAGNAGTCFKTVSGTSKSLDELTGSHQETFALFEFASRDDGVLRLIDEATDRVSSVWVMLDVVENMSGKMLPKEDTYFSIQFLTVTRLPSIIQILINHTDFEGATASSLTSRSSTEVSSYQGLPTDGPFPLFIWHPNSTAESTEPEIFNCHLCMNRLRSAVRNLVAVRTTETDTEEAKGETPSVAQRHTDERNMASRTTDVVVEESDVKPEEPSMDINSGNVPQPLTTDNVVIFVDSREHVDALKNILGLVNAENVIYPLEDLPHLTGSEKAIVGFVGSLTVQATGTVLQALVSKLHGVMTLCQGQLIVAVELKHDLMEPEPGVHQSQAEPFQLEIHDMLAESWKEHIATEDIGLPRGEHG